VDAKQALQVLHLNDDEASDIFSVESNGTPSTYKINNNKNNGSNYFQKKLHNSSAMWAKETQ